MALLSESIKGRMLLAIPKKGRLYDQCISLLAGADIQFFRSHRLDVCLVQNHPIALVFLPASDIPRFVGEGNVDLGITGQDMIRESRMDSRVTEVLQLGFGRCKLQVQVPEHSQYKTPEDLQGKRIATSFEVIAGEFFREIDEKAFAAAKERGEEPPASTIIEYVGGSVEAACALGLAEGIVDLVESGETMRAAGLHAIHTVDNTETVLISSRTPNPDFAPLMSRITSRIKGVIASTRFVLCQYNISRAMLQQATAITPGRRAATVSPLEDGEWVAVSALVKKDEVASAMDELAAIGAEDLLVIKLDNCRV